MPAPSRVSYCPVMHHVHEAEEAKDKALSKFMADMYAHQKELKAEMYAHQKDLKAEIATIKARMPTNGTGHATMDAYEC